MNEDSPVDIVIPTFNQSEFTVRCLDSIKRHTDPGRARVIWVDNGSDPAERSAVKSGLAKTRLRKLEVFADKNLGFVKATNAGVALSSAPVVVLLNNDTEVAPLWLEKLTGVLDREPEVGIVGPLTNHEDQWQWEGRARSADGSAYKVLPTGRMLAFFCAAVRREVITQCGYLSEEYGAGLGDDDDYCARAERAGWRLALRQDLVILHHHRTTFRAVYGEGGWLEAQRENIARFHKKWRSPAPEGREAESERRRPPRRPARWNRPS